MNYSFVENKNYLDVLASMDKVDNLLQAELKQIQAIKKDHPSVANLAAQYNNLLAAKCYVFGCLLRNGFTCKKTNENFEVKENGDYICIETPEEKYIVPNFALDSVLGEDYNEVIIPALEQERTGGGFALSENTKQRIIEEYKKDITQELYSEVYSELKESLENKVKENLKKELYDTTKSELRDELTPVVENSLKDELKVNLTPIVTEQLRTELAGEIRHEMKSDLAQDVKHEIKKDIEKEIREETADNIRQEIQKEVENTSKIDFLTAENQKAGCSLGIKENQLICSKNIVSVLENGTPVKQMEIRIYPLTLPTKTKDAPKLIASVKDLETQKVQILYNSHQTSLVLNISDVAEDTSIILRAKWMTINDKVNLVGLIMLNSIAGNLKLDIQSENIAPDKINPDGFNQTFRTQIKIDEKRIFNITAFPIYDKNNEDDKVEMLLLGSMDGQNITANTSRDRDNELDFTMPDKTLRVWGKWENGNFQICHTFIS